MNDYITEITLDLNCAKTPVAINSAQFDNGRKLCIAITADGNEFDISNCTAVFKGVRSDKTHFAIDCQVETNKVLVTFKDTDLSVKGLTIGKIVISDGTRTYSTQMCIIDVDSSLEGDITASDEYSILNRLIEQIHALNESGGILVDDELSEESNNPIQNATVTKALSQKVSSSVSSTQLIKLADTDIIVNGIHIIVNNNHISVKGTATSGIYDRIAIDAGLSRFEADTDYTISIQNTVDKTANYIGMLCNSHPIAIWDYESAKVIRLDTTTDLVLNWNIQAGTYDKEFDFQIELGTEVTPFEPYYVVTNVARNSIRKEMLSKDIQNDLDVMNTELPNKANASELTNKASFFEFEDITESVGIETGYYYGIFTHNSVTGFECVASPISCEEGDIFRITSATVNMDGYQAIVKCYDESQKLVSSYFEASGTDIRTVTDKVFIVPEGVKYVAFNCWKHDNSLYSLKVEKAKPYTNDYGLLLNTLVSSLPSSELFGKSIYSDGDSIAQGTGTANRSYAYLLADKYNMSLTSRAVGGTTLAVHPDNGDNKSIYERVIENITSDSKYDYIILDGGTNDITKLFNGTISLGVITDGINEEFDTTTILGALEAICLHLNTTQLTAKKLFVFPTSRVEMLKITNEVHAEMKKVLCKYGIPYIDLSNLNSLGHWDSNVAKDYYATITNANGEEVPDPLHPNIEGHKKFYLPYIEKALLYGSYIGSCSL